MEKYADAPFAIVGVNSDDSLEALNAAMTDENLTWSSFFDGGGTGGPIAVQWGVTGWPTVYILDHKGVIRYKGRSDLDETIAELVAEAEKAKAGAQAAAAGAGQ
ncbi:MAG: TlpA family protein disulfide reductase [Planctomycetes bacterium]|nr:TlpA family protein disulfide reductase [Planctomycetota bacterium]